MSIKELEEKCTEKGIDHKFLGRQLVQKKTCMTKDVGVHGNLFGGNLLSWIDEAAAGFISEMINFRPVVTLKISEVLFQEPVKVNDVVNIDVLIVSIGNSSIKVLVEVLNLKSKRTVCTCEMTFVHVDPETMKSKKI